VSRGTSDVSRPPFTDVSGDRLKVTVIFACLLQKASKHVAKLPYLL